VGTVFKIYFYLFFLAFRSQNIMNEQKKKGQSGRTWAKFGSKSSKGGTESGKPEAGRRLPTAEARKPEAGRRRLPATPPREPKRPQKKKKINKSEIGRDLKKQCLII
jgi:hypothetical protein